MKSRKKVKGNNNLNGEIKIINKEQVQQKQKAASERERAIKTSFIIKDLQKAKRELEKQNATLRKINLELETKLNSSNRHLSKKQ